MKKIIQDKIYDEMIEKAVYQQLFLGKDRIMGRMPETTMQFKNVEKLLTNFINSLSTKLNELDFNNIEEIIKYFENIFNLDLNESRERIKNNINEIDDISNQEILIFYMILTKILENIREQAYYNFGINVLIEKYEQITNFKFNDEVKQKIQKMSALGDKDISLLYNLCFIQLLAQVYKEQNILTNAKRQISKKITLIIKNINSSNYKKNRI